MEDIQHHLELKKIDWSIHTVQCSFKLLAVSSPEIWGHLLHETLQKTCRCQGVVGGQPLLVVHPCAWFNFGFQDSIIQEVNCSRACPTPSNTFFCQVDGPSFLALTSPAATIAIFLCGLEFIFGWVDGALLQLGVAPLIV